MARSATFVAAAAPYLGNAVMPGAGLVIGGALGGIASDAIQGKIKNFGDVGEAAAVGAAGTVLGGAVGRTIAGLKTAAYINRMRNVWSNNNLGIGTTHQLANELRSEIMGPKMAQGWRVGGALGGALTSAASQFGTIFSTPHAAALENWIEPGAVPTIDIGAGVLLPEMPRQLLMPGPDILARALDDLYRKAPALMVGHWRVFGRGTQAAVPQAAAPLMPPGQDSAGIPSYQQLYDHLAAKLAGFQDADRELAELVHMSAEVSATGKDAITDTIDYLNRSATAAPLADMTQDEWTTHYLQHALDTVQEAMHNAAQRMEKLGRQVGELQQQDPGDPQNSSVTTVLAAPSPVDHSRMA